MVGGQRWQAPGLAPQAEVRPDRGSTAAAVSLVSWWFVTWRARVMDQSRGNVEARLLALADAMRQLDMIAGLPGVHLLAPSSVVFEFWFEAGSAREAAGGARVALRQACKAAGIGDPAPHRDHSADILLMFEEAPTIQRDPS